MNKNINISHSYKIIIFSLLYGLSFYYLKMFSKQNSWLVIIIANLFGFLFIKMSLKIKSSYQNKNIYEINKIVLGNFIGTFINFLFSTIFFLLSTILSWYLFIFLKTNFLEKTPIYIIAIITFLPIFYTINKNNLVIIKSNVIFYYIIMILGIIAITFLAPQIEIDNLKPFAEVNKNDMFYAIFSIFSTVYLPTYALTSISDLKPKNSLFAKIMILTLAIILTTYMVLGNSITEMVDFPEFFVLRKIGLLANGTRIDSLIIIGWLISIYSTNIALLFFVRNFLKSGIKSYKNNHNYLLITLNLLLSLFIFKNVSQGKMFILNILPHILFSTIFIINFIVFLSIKKKPSLVSHNDYKNN